MITTSLQSALANTFIYYIPSWIIGVFLGFFACTLTWFAGRKPSYVVYLVVSGISFVPVTILIPWFMQIFSLKYFIFPLLAFPVSVTLHTAFYEALKHSNKYRKTLVINYGISHQEFFFRVLIREALPSMHTSLRITLSQCFAIFLALDYFLNIWRGLGYLSSSYYDRSAFSPEMNFMLAITIILAWAIGSAQVLLLEFMLSHYTEFRKHY
jgi:ABC-type nitrate/sulfonate/bicarbonate transport system permease component